MPTTACLTWSAEYSETGKPASTAAQIAVPRAWPSASVEAGLTWRIQIEPYAGPSVPSKAGQLMQVSVSVHNHRGKQLLALNSLVLLVDLSDRFLIGNLPGAVAADARAMLSAQATAHYVAWFISSYTVLDASSVSRDWSTPPSCVARMRTPGS